MEEFKATSKRKKIEGAVDSNTFKATSRKTFDVDAVKSWESENTASLNKINGYYDRIGKDEWLTEDERKDFRSAIDSYLTTSDSLRKINSEFGKGYTDDENKAWEDTVAGLKNGYNSVLDFYGSFDSSETFGVWRDRKNFINAYVENPDAALANYQYDPEWLSAAKSKKIYEDAKNDPEYKEYAKQGINIENPNPADALPVKGIGAYDLNSGVGGMLRWDGVKNKATYAYVARKNGNKMVLMDAEYARYSMMTEDEVLKYSYYLAKYGEDKAEEYFDSIAPKINERLSGIYTKAVDDIGAAINSFTQTVNPSAPDATDSLKALYGFASGMKQYANGMVNFFNDEDYYDTDALTLAGEKMKETLSTPYQIGYDMFSTVGNMFPSLMLSAIPVVGGAVSMASIGMSAAGNARAEMINAGYSDSEAGWYALIIGSLEAVLQKALGGIKFGSKGAGGIFQNLASKVLPKLNRAAYRVAVEIGANAVDEALEEGLQSVLEPLVKQAVTGDDYDIDWEEVGYSAMLGGLTGGLIEGSQTSVSTGLSSMNASNEFSTVESQKGLVSDALAVSPDSTHAKWAQSKLDQGKSLSGYQLNRLAVDTEEAIRTGDAKKISDSVKKRLLELGEGISFDSVTGKASIDEVADAITKSLMGESLTVAEKRALNNSKNAYRVMTEADPGNVASGNLANKWAENIGTTKYNAGAYNIGTLKSAVAAALKEDEENTSANTSATAEASAEAKIEASEKVTIVKDGKEVEVKPQRIASLENGEMTIELEGGTVVNANEVDFGEGVGLVYQAASEMASRVGGFNIDTANLFVQGFDPKSGLIAAEYVHGFTDAYRFGAKGFPVSELESGTYTSKLTDEQRTRAYNLGKAFGNEEIANKQAKIVSTVTKNAENNSKSPSKVKKGKLHFDGSVEGKNLTERQKASLKGLRTVAEAMGIDIYIFESEVVDGKRQGANGWYDPSDNSIHLDLYAGVKGESLILFTAAHELTHHIRETSPAKFKVFADALLEEYSKHGHSIEELIGNKMKDLKKNGRLEGLTEEQAYDLAYEEVVADAAETMLVDSNAIEALSKKLHAKDKGLWQTIKDFIANLVAKIKAAYKGLNPDSAEANYVRDMVDSAERLQKLWVDAIVEASEVSDMVSINTGSESVAPKFSERTWTKSEYVVHRDQMAEKIAKALDVSIHKAKTYIDDINSIAKLIADDRTRLDYEASSFGSAFVSNVEYGGSFDYTTLCKKRRIYTGTFTEIQKRLKDVALTPDDILTIRNLMIEEGIEATCGLCYVEGSRANMGKFAKEFIRLYKRDNPLAWIPNMADVNTPDGVEQMRISHPEAYDQYVYFWNHYGKLKDSDPALFASQQKPKLYEARKEYKGEILEHFKGDSTVAKKNLNGGIRMQSFSDFEIVHLIDTMQVIMDMSTVGLAGQAYTKVPEFARAFGNTGLKINLSLIAKGVDADGNLIFDDREGMPHETAFELRGKYSKNVGTIIVTFTDAQLLAAMADPRIDFIIPFHRSQWKKGQYGAMGLPKGTKDYTFMQNEKLLKQTYHEYRGKMVKDKASNYMPNEYWDFSKSGKENAEAYLKMCAENNKRPKFYKLLDYDGNVTYSLKEDGSTDGYWKLLIDFKMYDNNGVGSPQQAVTPTFNMDEAKTMLDEYQGGHSQYPVASSVVDKFVGKYNKEHRTKYSDRDSLGNELSKDQQEYFKDSKVRDQKGNLMVLYHGTTANFNTFKKGDVGFHFGTKGAARGRVGFGKNVTLKEVYLNITNPIVFDEDLGSWDADWRLTRELYDKGILTQSDAESVLFTDDRMYRRTTEAANKKLASILLEKGYDGIAYSNTFETKKATTSYIVFNSNQAKEITNKTPTSNPDIRYSFRDSGSGMANDALSPYNEELTKFIGQNGGFIVDSFDKLIEVVNLAFDNPNLKATAYFGIINTDTLEKIKNSIPNLPQASKDILFKKGKDYSIATTLDAIRHIVDDKNLNKEDVIDYLDRLADTILEFDTVNFDYYHQGSSKTPGLLFKKRFDDGTLVSFALVSHKKRSVVLQSLYLNAADYKKKKDAETLLMQNTSAHTSETQVGQPSANSIPQNTNSVKSKFSDRDSTYLDAVNRGDMETAQRMVDEAAKEAGYNSPKLYHGTKMFGFTEVKTSGVEKGAVWSPFFAANKEDISASYVPYGRVREISSTMDEDAIEEARENAIEERNENIATLVDDFRRLIDRHFSPWVFGQTDNSYLEELVENANPEAGSGDGVYDVLSEIVYDAYYDYQDEFGEYEDADDWSENSPEGQKIFSKIVEIEGEKSALHRLEMGEELGGIYQLYANLDNMYVVDGKGVAWNELRPEGLPKIERYGVKDAPYKTRDVAEWARDNGYDGAIFKNIRDNGAYGRTPAGDVYAFFRPESQIKSADPVTYDDNGNVIPLSERFNPKNSDIRYQDRNPDSFSNRSLLANALEGVAQNDIERNKLQQYKEKINLINAEQAKLQNLREQIKELSFAKGPRDTQAIKSLQLEANQTANRINTYDRQLLNLESTKALKGVLEREKKLAYQKAEKKGKEALSRYKEKAADTQRELITHYQEARKKGVDKRNKTAMRHRIISVVGDLNKLLLHESKERNIKAGLKAAVALALEAVNLDTVSADKRIADLEAELLKVNASNKVQNKLEKIAEIQHKIDYVRKLGDSMKDKLTALKSAYEEIASSADSSNQFKEEAALINTKVQSTIEKVGDTPLRDMTLSQLEAVHDLYKMVLTTVRDANKIWRQGKQEDLQQYAKSIEDEIAKLGKSPAEVTVIREWFRKFKWNEMIPYYFFENIGSETLAKLFYDFIEAQNTYAVDLDEAQLFAAEARAKHGYKKWQLDKVYSFKLNDGRTFETTLKHLLSIYAYSKRDQALDHMSVGGFFHNDKATFRKKGGVFELVRTDTEGYRVDAKTLFEIQNALTDEQKAYVEEMQEYLTKMGEKGNEVTRVLWGIDLFKEKVYFPLKSKDDFLKKSNETAQAVALKNDGMTKEVKPGASNPIVLEAFDDVWASHINRMSQYHAFVLPIDNMNKVTQYGTWASGEASSTVSTKIKGVYGTAATDYLQQFIKDINGNVVAQGVTNPIAGMFNKFKKTAVAASLSVIIQQPTAIARAIAEIDPRYFVGNPKFSWDEIRKYAPIAIIKDIGGFDAGSGVRAEKWLNKGAETGISKVTSAIDEYAMKGAEMADRLGWGNIWNAVKRETVHNNPTLNTNSEEFLKLCGKRFTEVIVKTQVYDSTLSRSAFMRSKHDIVKMLTSFMGEPTVAMNMLYNGVVTMVRGKSKAAIAKGARMIAAVYLASVLGAAFKSLISALNDDDEDESYWEKYMQALGNNVLGEVVLLPASSLPVFRDVVSIIQGYDVERGDLSVFKDVYDAFSSLSSDSKGTYKKVEDLAGSIAALFGIPAKNLLRTGRQFYNLGKTIFDDISGGNLGKSFVEGFTNEKRGVSEKIYDAILDGDDARLDVLLEGKSQSEIASAYRKALRENDSRIKEAAEAKAGGNFERYESIALSIELEGHFDRDDIKAAITSELNEITKEDTPSEESADKDEAVSWYNTADIHVAFEKGDNALAKKIIADIINNKVANGKTEKEAKSSIMRSMTSYWKPLYIAAHDSKNSEEKARIKNILIDSGFYGGKYAVDEILRDWLKN